MALDLAKEGASVLLTYTSPSSEAKAGAVVAAIEALHNGARAAAVKADSSSTDVGTVVVTAARALFGAGQTIDILVHNQDVARPLGITHPMPPDAAAAAADRVLTTPAGIKRWRNPKGVRLVATDIDWAWGEGQTVEAPMESHLMRLTGRE